MSSTSSTSAKKGVGKEFLCKVRYQNPLPPVPFPPKLLPVPPTYVDPSVGSYSQARLQHYVEYRHTTLEEATPYPMFVDADYGMPIDPCLLGAFDEEGEVPQQGAQELDKEDEFLLSLPAPAAAAAAAAEPSANGDGAPGAAPAAQPARPAAAAAAAAAAATATAAPAVAAGVHRAGGSAKRAFDHSLEGQLRAIDETFAYFAKYDAQADGPAALLRDLKHPTNNKLHAVEAVPLFPDAEIWANMYTVFSLDTCPEPEYAAADKTTTTMTPEERARLGDVARESLVFRPRVRQNNIGEDEQWIETFLPEDEGTAARLRARLAQGAPATAADADVEYRLEKSREYDMPVRPATHRQDLYMLTFDDGAESSSSNGAGGGRPVARYMPIKSRVLLKRRNAQLAGRQRDLADDPLHITSLDLQLRELSEEELQERAAAMDTLHEVIKEEVVRATAAAARGSDNDDEHVDVDDDLFGSDDDDDDDDASARRHRRPAPSYSPSP
ncbi:hypothetical protein H4R18_003423 [Coemansia javaensis]|uniref:RNA polymerase II-associated n=1 Tax=Coemansia javaensis TaxID=2761396 RepID=A0A9W8HAD7_9FUNG|nr:hypothetical protein H4R18_003423 [Coemansia javaensis]